MLINRWQAIIGPPINRWGSSLCNRLEFPVAASLWRSSGHVQWGGEFGSDSGSVHCISWCLQAIIPFCHDPLSSRLSKVTKAFRVIHVLHVARACLGIYWKDRGNTAVEEMWPAAATRSCMDGWRDFSAVVAGLVLCNRVLAYNVLT